MAWPTLRTYLAPTTQSLLRHLARSPAFPSTSVNLFAVSAQADDLQAVVSHLNSLPNAIGALSSSSIKGVQLSVASYPASSCLPFRSTIPGVPQAEVGRIRMYRAPTEGDRASAARLDEVLDGGATNWNDALSESGSLELPPDLEHIGSKSNVSSFLYLSDTAPEGLLHSLHRHFPAASQQGLIAGSTPFITGRPVTLFKGSNIFADGAVGLALFNQNTQRNEITFDNLQAVSPVLEVTQAQTNMVETLNHGNPVESLLLAMNSRGSIDKEQDIYLGAVDTTADLGPPGDQSSHKYGRVYKITAGGPTRGTILLDATEGPQVGAKVQFVVANRSQKSPTSPSNQPVPTISFDTITDSDIGTISAESEVKEIENLFLATSENGFVVGSSGAGVLQRPWVCNIPGANYKVQWHKP
ncbi:hypothetical protein FRC08_003581 [Ceratobasidium sp. 394]|nr:hypothetical protein FRC08_003581 [Ceratobasidium sp. 394]